MNVCQPNHPTLIILVIARAVFELKFEFHTLVKLTFTEVIVLKLLYFGILNAFLVSLVSGACKNV